MSRKRPESRPTTASRREPPTPPARSNRVLVTAVVVALCAGIALLAYVRTGRAQPEDASASTTPAAGSAEPASAQAAPPAADPSEPPANAHFGPHKQPTLPPLPFSSIPPQRPIDVVTAVYRFAAEHPEVLGYVPCYCGCERGGHRGNDDCFVSSRSANGDVTSWEPHGMT